MDIHDPISRSAAVEAPSDRRRAGPLPVIAQALKNPPPKKAGGPKSKVQQKRIAIRIVYRKQRLRNLSKVREPIAARRSIAP